MLKVFDDPLLHINLYLWFKCSRSGMSDEQSYPASPNHPPQEGVVLGPDGKEHLTGPNQTQSLDRAYRPPAAATTAAQGRQHSLGRMQPHHGPTPADPSLNGPRPAASKEARCVSQLPLSSLLLCPFLLFYLS